ncbi:M28 family peptidase [Micrococcus terreus]|uniref:M28 family peptidase n=1 Tax=Micrococcus terreus TaxID=574650 RepID=UPI0030175B89
MSHSRPQSSPQLSRRALLALGGAGALSTIAWPSWAADGARPGAVRAPRLTSGDRQIISQLRPENAIEHLTHLTEGIGQRYSGTPQEKAAADYLAGVLDSYGYDVELQEFTVPDRRVGELNGAALDSRIAWGVGSAARAVQDTTVRGTLTVAVSGSPADLPPDLRGQILMRVVTVTEDITPLAVAAAARGAEAVIATRVDAAYPRQASAFAPNLTADVGIPVVGVGQVQKHALLTALSRGPVTLSLTTVQYLSPTSQNVLARRAGKKGGPPSRSRQEVMLCAHYDSVIGARGANDDGSGTVLCLELARTMRNLPTSSDLSFSLWGSEEVGLVGSRLYARGLDAAQKARLSGVFNNDMVGTSWDPAEKYWVLDYFGQSNPVNAQVLAAGERLGYRAQMSYVTPRGASDHQSFSEVGVHSGNFSWRGVETPALLEPEYHSADDTIAANISVERLTISMEIQGAAALALARS